MVFLERCVASRLTKRTLDPGAKPIGAEDRPEPEALRAILDAWTAVLKDHVRPAAGDGVRYNGVSYVALARDDRFAGVLRALADLDAAEVAREWSPTARCALYINAYNALCADHVCRRLRDGADLPASVTELKDGATPVWKREAGVVAGEALALDAIEHGILRARFDEPRVHACVNCASRSCPDLLAEAYRGDGRLDGQLSDQFRKWMADTTKGLDATTKGITLSRIFLWYAQDFAHKPAAYCAAFVAAGATKDQLARTRSPAYFPYDWRLNVQ